MSTRKPIEPAWLLVPGIMTIFIFSAITWLSTSDSYVGPNGTYTITGWEVLRLMYPSFFVRIWLGFLGVAIFSTLAYVNETGAWIGKYLRGNTAITILFVILALACLITPWLPAFTVKVDGGQFSKPKTQLQSSLYELNHQGCTLSVVSTNSSCCTDGLLFKRR